MRFTSVFPLHLGQNISASYHFCVAGSENPPTSREVADRERERPEKIGVLDLFIVVGIVGKTLLRRLAFNRVQLHNEIPVVGNSHLVRTRGLIKEQHIRTIHERAYQAYLLLGTL